MIGALIWCLVVIVVRVLIAQGKMSCVGWNYGNVVASGEWWRLAVAPLCHATNGHLFLTVLALLNTGSSRFVKSEWAIGVGSIVVSAASNLLCLGVVGRLSSSGEASRELSVEPGSTRWMSHGCSSVALSWIVCLPADAFAVGELSTRPFLVALLFFFWIQLVAPDEPALPLVSGCFVGYVLSKSAALQATLVSPYWTSTVVAWLALIALASARATRPRIRVPGFTYSHWPPPPYDEQLVVAPDGAPTFRIVAVDRESTPSTERAAGERPRLPVDWAIEESPPIDLFADLQQRNGIFFDNDSLPRPHNNT